MSAIDSSKKIEKDLKIFKYGKKEPQKKEENIDENKLINLPRKKLYKLFFSNKKSKQKKILKKQEEKKLSSKDKKKGKENKSLFFKNNSSNNSENNIKETKNVKIEIINDISVIKDTNSILDESSEKRFFPLMNT